MSRVRGQLVLLMGTLRQAQEQARGIEEGRRTREIILLREHLRTATEYARRAREGMGA